MSHNALFKKFEITICIPKYTFVHIKMETNTQSTKQTFVSKKRYNDYREALITELKLDEAVVDTAMAIFCRVMSYDPNTKTYTEARKRALQNYRQKLKDKM